MKNSSSHIIIEQERVYVLLTETGNDKMSCNERRSAGRLLKVTAVVWMVLYFLNLLLPDGLAFRVFDPYVDELYSRLACGNHIWLVILKWMSDSAFVFLPLAVFTDRKTFARIVSLFVLPVAIICLLCTNSFMAVIFDQLSDGTYIGAGLRLLRFFDEEAAAVFLDRGLRTGYYVVMYLLEIGVSVGVLLSSRKGLRFENRKSVCKFFEVLVFFVAISMPVYAPMYIGRGYGDSDSFWAFKAFSPAQLAWVIATVILGVAIYQALKRHSREEKYIVMVGITLAMFYQFNGLLTFFGELVAHRFPLQLCNIAAVIYLITLLTKNRAFSRFMVITNVLGAILAYVFCDSSSYGMTYIMNVHYIAQHTWVVLVPILCQALGIFEPLERRDIKSLFTGYNVYYFFIFIVGGIFTGLLELTGNDFWSCNYLYMFDKEASSNLLPFIAPLFDCKITLFGFFPITLVEPVVYLVFLGLSVAAFYLVYLLSKRKKSGRPKTALQ